MVNLEPGFTLFIQVKSHVPGTLFDSDRQKEIRCMYQYYICKIAKSLYHLRICVLAILQIP
jgi:hypothetical protein